MLKFLLWKNCFVLKAKTIISKRSLSLKKQFSFQSAIHGKQRFILNDFFNFDRFLIKNNRLKSNEPKTTADIYPAHLHKTHQIHFVNNPPSNDIKMSRKFARALRERNPYLRIFPVTSFISGHSWSKQRTLHDPGEGVRAGSE